MKKFILRLQYYNKEGDIVSDNFAGTVPQQIRLREMVVIEVHVAYLPSNIKCLSYGLNLI